MISKIGNII